MGLVEYVLQRACQSHIVSERFFSTSFSP
jgi:hypothetical protein